jgi:hypothetical protein
VSLLADLLSKVKYKSASAGEGRKTDVPPDLKRVVSSSAEKEAVKKKIIVFSILVLVAIITGAGAVYFMELYTKPSATKIVRNQNTENRTQTLEDRSQESVASRQESEQKTKNKEQSAQRSMHDAQRMTNDAKAAKPKPKKGVKSLESRVRKRK